MAQPEPEWWVSFLKWAETNTLMFIIAGLCWKGIDKLFAFLNKLIDGKLQKIVDVAIAEKVKEFDDKFDKMDEKLTHLITSLIDKK